MSEPMERATFLKGAAMVGVGSVVGTRPGRGLTYRGVCYDTGTEYEPGSTNRPLWTAALMRTDIRTIADRLHCNSVILQGTDVGRLATTAEFALRRGLQVSIQPRLFDRPQPRVLDHLARTARQAERLRRAHRPEVILVIGCEYILFTPGIVPGRDFLERIKFLTEGTYDIKVILRRLQRFVDKAVAVARRHFRGRITYGAAAGLEDIDWSPFDIVGLDYYSYHRRARDHTKELRPYRRWRKPIMILEFGCCTFRGAAERGGDGWKIVDYGGEVPRIKPGYVRSEREQARHLANMLNVFEGEGLLGAAPYQFVAADLPHSRKRDFDLDMASYSLVKVIRERHDDPLSPYRWEPKQSFYAVAEHNKAKTFASHPSRPT